MSNKTSNKIDLSSKKSNHDQNTLVNQKTLINHLLQRISNGQSGVVLEELL
ncbi:hypothetical protein VSA01S_29600 [Vibrio sagamiensis NBRC 104589]|uniref:Uncharacterized protein n=1 Tax=Vibrio sagamiensis NBRC 104589 TaxID=1219064 RepID=A0A511QHR9_9VIBR|nr:hypothetical protein VSA01S_29600 [Vibrio sagamiensis NBRC 104589]